MEALTQYERNLVRLVRDLLRDKGSVALADRIDAEVLGEDQGDGTRAELAVEPTVAPDLGRLTPREKQVLEHIMSGNSSKVTASALGISPRTVEVHRASIIEKFRARNTADLVKKVLLS